MQLDSNLLVSTQLIETNLSIIRIKFSK